MNKILLLNQQTVSSISTSNNIFELLLIILSGTTFFWYIFIRYRGHLKNNIDKYNRTSCFKDSYIALQCSPIISLHTNVANKNKISNLQTYVSKYIFNNNTNTLMLIGDSGCGKSTFLKHLNSNFNLQNSNTQLKILYIALDQSSVFSKIDRIQRYERKNTVLLLDGLDELQFILSKNKADTISSDSKKTLYFIELLKTISDFNKTIITTKAENYLEGFITDKNQQIKGHKCISAIQLLPINNNDIKEYNQNNNSVNRYSIFKNLFCCNNQKNVNTNISTIPILLSCQEIFVNLPNQFMNNNYLVLDMAVKHLCRVQFHNNINKSNKAKDLFMFFKDIASQLLSEKKLYISSEDISQHCKNHNITTNTLKLNRKVPLKECNNEWRFKNIIYLEYFAAYMDIENSDNTDCLVNSEIGSRLSIYQIPQMVDLEGSEFKMGQGYDIDLINNSLTTIEHTVKLSAFSISKHTISVEQFARFVLETNYLSDAEKLDGSYIYNKKTWVLDGKSNWRFDTFGKEQNEPKMPVVHISWNDANAYCNWLSEKHNTKFRLPTEAEWEYACRANTSSRYNTGSILKSEDSNFASASNFNNDFTISLSSIDSFAPNNWGIYNMHGNVWEWCSDWFSESYYLLCKHNGLAKNPSGPVSGSSRVLRGGGLDSSEENCSSATRCKREPQARIGSYGFRVVQEAT